MTHDKKVILSIRMALLQFGSIYQILNVLNVKKSQTLHMKRNTNDATKKVLNCETENKNINIRT